MSIIMLDMKIHARDVGSSVLIFGRHGGPIIRKLLIKIITMLIF